MVIKDFYWVCDYYGYKTPDKEKTKVPVQLYLALEQRKRKLLPPVVKINPDGWDKEKNKITAKCEDAILVRRQLAEYLNKVEDIQLQCAADKVPFTVDFLQKYLNNEIERKKPEPLFIDYAVKMIEGQSISNLTIAGKIRSVNKLNDFKPNVRFEEINWKFIKDFNDWLKRKENGQRVFSDNYCARVFKDVKSVLNYAKRDQDIKSITINSFPIDSSNSMGFKRTKFVFLTKNELDSLYNVKPVNKRLELVHARFMFACYTGLRHSDINRLSDDYIKFTNEGLVLDMGTQKTDTHVQIPLWQHFDGHAQEMVNKLKELNYPSRTDDNVYLKELTEAAGIDKEITFHVARHSFITNLLHEGVPMVKVMFMAGINKIDTIRTYMHNAEMYYN